MTTDTTIEQQQKVSLFVFKTLHSIGHQKAEVQCPDSTLATREGWKENLPQKSRELKQCLLGMYVYRNGLEFPVKSQELNYLRWVKKEE